MPFDVDYLIVLVYLAGIMAIGLYASRGMTTLNQYAVAGRTFAAPVVFATLSASFIGGGFTLGNAEKVYLWGIVNIIALWGFSLKEVLVATVIAPRMQPHRDAISIGDIMAKSYGKLGRLLAGVFSVMLCFGIVGAQVGAIGYVFELFLNIPRFWGVLIGCGIVIIYVTLGGMRAVVFTDLAQFAILAVGLPLTLIFGIIAAGGVGEVVAQIPSEHFQLTGHLTWVALISLFLTFLLGETLVPPYMQRLFIGKDTQAIARGTLWSGLFSIPFFAITGAIGLVALAMAPELDPNLAIPYVIQTALPVGITGLVVASIICVVMSSADSFLNAAAVAFTNDIVKPLRRNLLSDAQGLWIAKVVTLIGGICAIIFALKIESVLDILIYAYHVWAPVMVMPLVAAIFGMRSNSKVYLISVACGLLGMLLWSYGLGQPWGLDSLIAGVAANIVGLWLGQKLLGPHGTASVISSQESV